MADVVANALKRKKELEKELRQIEAFLKECKRFARIDSARVKTENIEEGPVRTLQFINPRTGQVSRTIQIKRRGRPLELASLIEAILKKQAAPMTRSEIAHELEIRGHAITSTDKAAYIGTILWRHRNRFSNIEGKGYWLKGIKVPETVEEKFRIRAGAGYME